MSAFHATRGRNLGLVHGQRGTRWACTQTSVCTIVGGRLATIDLLCSGFREIQG